MRMGVDADRADATELLSTGAGATKADTPTMRSADVHATYLGAMIAFVASSHNLTEYRSEGSRSSHASA